MAATDHSSKPLEFFTIKLPRYQRLAEDHGESYRAPKESIKGDAETDNQSQTGKVPPPTSDQNGDTAGEVPSPQKPESKMSDSRPFLQRHAFMITLLVNTMADGLGWSVRFQFRYHFFREQYRDQLNQFNTSSSGACGNNDVDPRLMEIEEKITAATTAWGRYEWFLMIVPLMMASLVIGMKSDQIGRRFIYLFPFFTTMVDCAILALVIKLKWHFGYTFIGTVIWALSGGSISMAFAAYALISDTHGTGTTEGDSDTKVISKDIQQLHVQGSSENDGKTFLQATPGDPHTDERDLDMSREGSRTLKIVGLDIMRSLSRAAISFVTGYVIQYAGFFYTMFLVLGVKVMLFVFAFIFVTETGRQRKSEGFLAPLRTILRATKQPRRRLTLLLVNLGLMFSVFSVVDEMEVLPTYQLSPPFCFSPVQLGWFASESRLKSVLVIPLLFLWQRLGMLESTIAGVGLVFWSASNLLLASVRQSWVFFVIPIIAIPGELTFSMSKVITSRMIGRKALASTFALMLAGEELFAFMGGIVSTYLYQYALHTLPTAPFYLSAACFFLSSFLYFGETFNQRTWRKIDLEEKVICDESLA